MEATDIEKLKQLISRTDISGNDKVSWLTDFIDGREFQVYEKSYSEEDIRIAFRVGYSSGYKKDTFSYKEADKLFTKWYKLFKK